MDGKKDRKGDDLDDISARDGMALRRVSMGSALWMVLPGGQQI